MLYTVGEMAKKLGVAPSTLRYYDKEGLLPFLERSGGGIRVFRDEDFEYLSTIECLKKTGMTIRDIRVFIGWCLEGDDTIGQRLALVDRQREAVLAQMEQMKETLAMLDYKHWYYETAEKAGTCAVHAAMKEDEVPKEFRNAREKAKGVPGVE
ncbi:MerR family transcriptional regulator [Desulfosporosinus youngiae]|uniref:Putative transcriptional regulator n=1 Tax=Desulfosporosinus youngiae DSM 17734 TaxID=768710 RepID=H5XW43_9FIRM|nr:MerR family transcriptional regulator [Desulfosporosinus youngiae]EHQ90636.1 putative transcriptional regulator [Desulfosporosinus youngiae DSM 17734]